MPELQTIYGWCKIVPRRRGNKLTLPPGFLVDGEYRILMAMVPNGCQDLHFWVINEIGQVAALTHQDVTITDSGEHRWEFPFETESTHWVLPMDKWRRGHLYVVCCFNSDNEVIHPDLISWNHDLSVVTVTWPIATKGTLILR